MSGRMDDHGGKPTGKGTGKSGRAGAGERGVALVAVVVVLAVMGATTADFAFNTTLDLAEAANARDDLRAHYLARSGINLARLLLRVQQRVIDPNRKYLGGMDLQIADYAPLLISAFNSKEGAEMLGSLFGVGGGDIKGLGVDVGSFDLDMTSLDGKLNVNCAGGVNAGSPTVVRTAASLAAIMLPPRYNRLFEEPDDKGNYADRLEIMRAIIDWVDQDGVMFGSCGGLSLQRAQRPLRDQEPVPRHGGGDAAHQGGGRRFLGRVQERLHGIWRLQGEH